MPIEPMQPPPTSGRKKSLVALIGLTAAAMVTPLVATWEGKENDPYRDIVGVWTVCYGDTANVVPGQRQSDAECNARLERQLVAHAEPVVRCTPGLAARPGPLAAAVSLAYNIGPAAYCGSTAARRFNAGDIAGGCNAILRWNRAGGREVKGLTRRREAERRICLQ